MREIFAPPHRVALVRIQDDAGLMGLVNERSTEATYHVDDGFRNVEACVLVDQESSNQLASSVKRSDAWYVQS